MFSYAFGQFRTYPTQIFDNNLDRSHFLDDVAKTIHASDGSGLIISCRLAAINIDRSIRSRCKYEQCYSLIFFVDGENRTFRSKPETSHATFLGRLVEVQTGTLIHFPQDRKHNVIGPMKRDGSI